MAEPLTRAQKRFNQRLLAEHSLTHDEAEELWEHCHQDEESSKPSKLADGLMEINQQLKYAGLEIVGVHVASPSVNDNSQPSQTSNHDTVLHLCLIDCHHVSSSSNNSNNADPSQLVGKYPTAAQHNYARAVLQHLVEQQTAVKRAALLNLRLEDCSEQSQSQQQNNNNNSHLKTDCTLLAADQVLQDLVHGKWLQQSGGQRLSLAPRAFAELGTLFTQEFGLNPDDMPQQIFYR